MKSRPSTLLSTGALVLNVLLLAIMAVAFQSTASQGSLNVSSIGAGPLFLEGAIIYFRVRSGNSRWTEKSLGGFRAPTVFALPAADYELESFVRPCDGNCGYLDPPTDRCSARFSIVAGKTLYAARHQTPSGMCTLTIASTASREP